MSSGPVLIFINRFFHPDHSATSQMLSDLAFELAQGGRRVLVITSRQLYDAPAERLPARDKIGGVEIHRVWTSRFGRLNLLGRAIDYLTFYISAAWTLWRLARAGDVVIAKTDPPMLSVIAAPIARWRRASLVNWLQDVFPEVAQALGHGQGRAAKPVYRVLRTLRDRSLRSAAANVVLGERMAAHLVALGVHGDRVRVIGNFADATRLRPVDCGNGIRSDWLLDDKFVVGYSGNLGRAHEYQTMLAAMERTGPDTVWLLLGGGALFSELKHEVAVRRMANVRFEPYQPNERLAESLSAADVHLVSLRPELEGLIVPSKFYGICAVGRPSIFIGDSDGEVARLMRRHGCGYVIQPGDGEALARTVAALAEDRELGRQMGVRARRAFEAEFDKSIAVAHWQSLLDEVSCRSVGSTPVLARGAERASKANTP